MSIIVKEFEVEGIKAKEKLKVLFDSGSNRSFIRKDAAEKIGFSETPTKITITQADGKTIEQKVEGSSILKFRINGCEISGSFLVKNDLIEEMIIGTDELQNRKLIIDMEKEDIDTSKCRRYQVA